MKILLENGVEITPPNVIAEKILVMLISDKGVYQANAAEAGQKVKRKYKKAAIKKKKEKQDQEEPEAEGGGELDESEVRSLRDLSEAEKTNIKELHKRGEGPAKIARMFKLKPQAISNFIIRERITQTL